MGTQKQVIQIDAQINTHLGNLNDTVTKLKKGISDGVTKMDLSKGAGKAFSGYIRDFQNSYAELQKYIKKDASGNSFIQLDDSGKAISAGKNLLKVFGDIQQVMQGINSKDAAGLAKLFPQGSIGDVDKLLKSLEGLSPKLKELQDKEALRIAVTSDIKTLEAEIQRIKTGLKDENVLKVNVDNAKTALNEVEAEIKQIQDRAKEKIPVQIKTLTDDKTNDIAQRDKMVAEKNEAIARMEQSGVTRTKSGKLQFQGMTESLWQINSSRGADAKKAATEAFAAYKQAQSQASGLEKQITSLDAKIEASKKKLEELAQISQKLETPEGTATLTKEEMQAAGFSAQEIEAATAATQKRTQAQQELNEAVKQQSTQAQQKEDLGGMEAALEKKKKQVEQLGNELAKLAEKANLSEMAKKLQELGFENVTEDTLKSKEGIENLKTSLTTMKGEKVQEIVNKLKEMGIISEDTAGDIKLVEGALEKTGESADSINRAERDMENLKNRMLDFFSISNSIRLFKRTLQQAFNTVKELDAVMTQTAVVTDFSVGDMWDKLPEYSARATELGASISSLYQATTLYYQQGLETEAAMGVGIETMKMARIAGMEATEATQAMTAALRGFNMEVNEMNATRVNDVYSELAAITAADTEQIATAMSKTASIASSANMEFETTAALLAQIIETTQEAPETAGTAMKTIIARFTEVKSLFSEGQLKGEDEEGEAIDINKIDAALKSVGISLKDFLNGKKGIDDIFLELASKWDTLDLATQRYIATTAAGSRQQSRFIAMMSDYGRTMELVSAANNSAGASQKQFDKTQESLEAKLQKLKNAWQQFTMSIMNSDVIKAGVDALTKILETVNILIDKLSGGSGLIKSFLSLGTAIAAISGGNALLGTIFKSPTGGLMGGIGGAITKFLGGETGGGGKSLFSGLGKSLASGFGKAFSTAKIPFDSLKAVLFNGITKIFPSLGAKVALAMSSATIGAIAGIGVIVGIAIAKAIDRAIETAEEKRARLEAQAEQAEEQVKQSRNKRDTLKSDLASLKQLEKGFEGLTQGTAEWRQQLVQVNEQVLGLIEKYPELQIETGDLGQLTISEESYQALLKQQEQQIDALTAVEASAQLDLEEMNYSETLKKYDSYKTGQKVKRAGSGYVHGDGQNNAEVDEVINWTAGFSEDQIRSYMSALTEAGINSTNIRNQADYVKSILISKGFAGDVDNFIKHLSALGSEFDKLGAASLSATIKMEAYADTYFRAAAGSKTNQNMTEEAAVNFLELAYGGAEGLKEMTLAREKALLENRTDEQLLKEYAEYMGYYFSDGKVWKDESKSEQISVTREQAASGMADYQIKNEATDLLDNLNLNTQEKKEDFEKYFGKKSQNLNMADLENMNVDELAALLGTDGKQKNEDGTLTDYGKGLQQYIDMLANRTRQNQIDVSSYFMRYNPPRYVGKDIDAGDYNTFINGKYLKDLQSNIPNFNELLLSAMSSVELSGNEDLIGQVFNELVLTETGSFKEASDLISSIDWSNPIEAMDQINSAMHSGNAATSEFATRLSKLQNSFFGLGSQVKYFAESTEFSEVQEDIQKIIDKSGELTGMDIMELADDYEALDKIIKNNSVSVAGLAKVFSELGENGSLKVHQLTNAVLAAASGFDSLDGIVAEALDSIEKFDPGLNETEVVDFANKAYKTLTDNFEKGYWGNNQNFEYLDYFFGPGWDDGLSGDALRQKMQELTSIIGEGDHNLGEAWNKLFGKDFDISSLYGLTSDEMVSELMSQSSTPITEEYAQALLAYRKNIDPDFANRTNTANFKSGIENAYDAANVGDNEQKIIDESEIAAIADLYKKDIDDVRAYFKARGAIVTDFYDKDGILEDTNEIVAQMDKIFDDGHKGSWGRRQYDSSTGHFRGYQAREDLTNAGITNKEDQNRILNEQYAQMAEQAGGKIIVEEKTSTGAIKELEITADVTYDQALANAEATAQAEIWAEVFKMEMSDVPASLTFDEAAIRNQIQLILTDSFEITANVGKVTFSEGIAPTLYKHATGIKNSPTTHSALVSEEGPELIQKADGTAYLSGLNGPEITEINRGDTVYTADETKKIYSNHSKGFMPRYAGGFGKIAAISYMEGEKEIYVEVKVEPPVVVVDKDQAFENIFGNESDNDSDSNSNSNSNSNFGSNSSSGSSSSSNEQFTEIKTSLDKLYNLLAQIEETTRQRERLERRYEALIKDTDSSIKDVVDNSKAQLAVLEAEKELQESLIKGRQAQIEAYTAQNAGYAQYAGVETNAYGDQVMRIDWDAINAISNDDERKKVEEYVSKLEGWLDELTEAEDALWDIEDAVEEINERGKEEYLDLENQIKEALISERQEEIDKLSAIDESINNANSSMMQAIQDTLSQQRQERDNAKTEEELAEKERRLQYLKQDTSGANALEIMELEKELAEGREDYTDTLIDQKIEELQKQNDQAAEQRQKQIDILSKQLEMYEKSDELWNKVHSLMETGIDDDGIRIGSSLHKLFEHYITKDGLSAIGEQKWWSDLDATIKNGMAWLQTGQQIENLSDKPEGEITFKVGDQEFTGTVQDNGDVKTAEGAVYTEVYRGVNGKYYTSEGKKEPSKPDSEKPEEQKPSTPDWYEKLKNIGYVGYGVADGDDVEAVEMALKELGYWDDRGTIDKHFDSWTDHAIRKFQLATIGSADGQLGSTTKTKLIEAAKKKLGLTQFKTGGVADFTGPAWLDGTKSRPEIILNQQDSHNFIQLKDILGSILKGNHYSSSSTENNGDTVYDIDINVEKLEREVDLDTISNYVERKITETARYRNNNAVKISR